MSSKVVIRLPVDNDPDIEESGIPAVAKRMAAEGLETSSQAAVIRWAIRDAANPRRRSTTNAGIQNDGARSVIDELRAELEAERAKSAKLDTRLTDAACELVNAHQRRIDVEEELAREQRMAQEAEYSCAEALAKLDALAATPVQVATNVDGARLKAAREAAELSQQALADLLGYRDRSAVSLAERGRAPISPSMAKWLEGSGR